MSKLAKLSPEDEKRLQAATVPPQELCCIIPARGGSKRIKHKNKRLLLGRPLFDYVLKAAVDSKLFSLIIVTSDDEDILEHAYKYFSHGNVQPNKRPKGLCGDEVPIKNVIRWMIHSYAIPPIPICLLQPTNPLVTAEQIKEAYEIFKTTKHDFLLEMWKGGDMGFHFFNRDAFFKHYDDLWDMSKTDWIPYEREGIDIDEETDWLEAERLLNEKSINNGR